MPLTCESMLSAALRHARDAERLLVDSPDQAWHLAGFAPECARKACLTASDWSLQILGHHQGDRLEDLLEWVLGLDPQASRYRLEGWAQEHPVLQAWTPQHRYEATGTCEQRGLPVSALVTSARVLVDRIHVSRWADGVLVKPEA